MRRRGGICISLLVVVCLVTAPRSGAAQQTGSVSGRVVDSLAAGVRGATVALDTLGLTTTTDSSGNFRIGGVPVGLRAVTVHAIGVVSASVAVRVAAGADAKTVITVSPVGQQAATLPTVSTHAEGAYGKPARLAYTTKYDGFYERRAESTAGGHFYTHEDLVKLDHADLPDMLGLMAGLRVTKDIDRNELHFVGCGTDHILILLDNERVWPRNIAETEPLGTVPSPGTQNKRTPGEDPFELLASLHIQNVEAVEIYHNYASLPLEAMSGNFCGAIIIWTR